ncbi:MAG: hypothetical protein EOP32_10340 [Rhodococcus sp. (in: high G+C Gram-positive bacteria)]|nr:MAG: hypothetical protein EOP32_10340 [Rhodococcus sp. (in: high G+C Gram-positive bacteria)]
MGEPGRASTAHVMVALWWSRGDALANHLGQILTRAGCVDVDITDPQSIDKALRIAVTGAVVA